MEGLPLLPCMLQVSIQPTGDANVIVLDGATSILSVTTAEFSLTTIGVKSAHVVRAKSCLADPSICLRLTCVDQLRGKENPFWSRLDHIRFSEEIESHKELSYHSEVSSRNYTFVTECLMSLVE